MTDNLEVNAEGPAELAALRARFLHDLRSPLAGLLSIDAEIDRLEPAAQEIFRDVVARLRAMAEAYT